METFSGLSRVRLAKSGAGGSQNREEKGKPGACKNTCVIERLGSRSEKALRDTEALSPFVYLQIQDVRPAPKSQPWTIALGFLSAVFLISLLVTDCGLTSITAAISTSLTF